MPKSKSSARAQQRAGAAAVYTTRTPHPPPDTAAFHSFVPAFSLVLQQAGVCPVLLQQILSGNERLWQACRSYDGSTKSRSTITTCASRACGLITSGSSTQHFLVALLIRRTLAAANMHSHILSFLKGQQKVTEDVLDCFFLLGMLADNVPEELKNSLPKECLQPPYQSAEAFAASHWHPKIIALALKALLTASNEKGGLFAVKGYLSNLRDATVRPLQAQLESPTLRAGVHDVLSDQECMDLLWKVCKHPGHTGTAVYVYVLCILVAAADTPPGGPGSLSNLLKMGAAAPLAHALKHLTQQVEQQQRQCLKQLPQPCTPEFGYAERLARLVACIQKAAVHDLPSEAGPGMNSTEGLPPWPENLLEAFLLGAIKAMEMDPRTAPDVTAPPVVPMDMVKLPPPSSYPASARVMSRHPASLRLLILCIQRSADRSAITERAVEVCNIGFEFLASLLDAVDDTAFQQSLPLPELCTCIATVINSVRPWRFIRSSSAELVCVTARLLKRLEGLPGVIGMIDSCILGSCAEDIISEWEAGVVSEGAVGSAHVNAGHPSSGRDCSGISAGCMCVREEMHFRTDRYWGIRAGADVSAGGGSSKGVSGSSEAGSAARAGPKGTASASSPCRECAHCGKNGKLKACSRCRAVFYCGLECQSAGWATHRQVCKPQGA